MHGWDTTNQHWASHIATNHPAIDPANNLIVAMDVNGDLRDEFVLIKLGASASGRIEVHTWLPGQQSWLSNIATNHPVISATNNTVIAADLNGDNIDELSLVKLGASASGRIEVHTWLPGQQSWLSNIATNHPVISPANNSIIASDTDGDNRDLFSLVKYRSTGSSKIEVHTWLPGQQSWLSNIATNRAQLPPE